MSKQEDRRKRDVVIESLVVHQLSRPARSVQEYRAALQAAGAKIIRGLIHMVGGVCVLLFMLAGCEAAEPGARDVQCAQMAALEHLPINPDFEVAGDMVWEALGAPGQRPQLVLIEAGVMEDGWGGISGTSCDGGIAYISARERPSASSISHELLHFALWRAGDPDRQHTRPEWDTLPRELNMELWNAGL